MHNDLLPYWLALLFIPVSPKTLIKRLALFTDPRDLLCASTATLQAVGFNAQQCAAIVQPPWNIIADNIHWLAADRSRELITWHDPQYPARLREIAQPPLVLFVQGNITLLQQAQIAIVGTRKASQAGLNTAQEFAKQLVAQHWTITSGLARGIDAAGHQGALAGGGRTIAVMGTGLDEIYPRVHRQLADAILAQQGTLVAELPIRTPPRPYVFPRRNRVISGLSCGVVIVEAALNSGSLITAQHALNEGREVFAIPGSIYSSLSRGCHALIKQGAKLIETVDDILEELSAYQPSTTVSTHSKTSTLPALSPAEQQVLMHITTDTTPLDVIVLKSGLSLGTISTIVLNLELKYYIQAVPGGYQRMM